MNNTTIFDLIICIQTQYLSMSISNQKPIYFQLCLDTDQIYLLILKLFFKIFFITLQFIMLRY